MRIWLAVAVMAVSGQGALAAKPAKGPYYGPMKAGMGYKDRVEKDGSIRIEAATRRDRAVDVALYRAAEIAHRQGYAYVEMLGGRGRRNSFEDSATLYARPSNSPLPPANCPSKKAGACYTADVAEILHRLGGPGGTQPGLAIVDHIEDGSEVSYSGYGIGAVTARPRFVPVPARLPSPAIVAVASRASAYATVLIPPSPGALPQSFAQRMARPVAIAATAPAARPVRASRRHVVNEGVVIGD